MASGDFESREVRHRLNTVQTFPVVYFARRLAFPTTPEGKGRYQQGAPGGGGVFTDTLGPFSPGGLDFVLGKSYLTVKQKNHAIQKGVIFAMMREKGEFRMLNEIGMAAFEESVRSQIEEERSSRNMTESSLGKLAFPHVADARRKVQSIRKGQGAGENRKPQQLRGTDILNLCEAVGLPWKKVFDQAIKYAERVQEEARLAAIK